jgi:catechol 2,3-dioxygenase-like lactoylglutathione lyase family enzyme
VPAMSAFIKLLSAMLVVGGLGACTATRNQLPPRVSHIRLQVSNMQASVAFYRMIGLRPRSVTEDFSVLDAANLGVFLLTQSWSWMPPLPKDAQPGWGMYPHFEVDDVEGLTARLKAAGYKVVQEPEHHTFGTEAFVADPDGYVWALIH